MSKRQYANTFTQVIHPGQGSWKSEALNLLLRLTVKSRLGLHIDIPKLRKQFSQLNRQASPSLLASVQRQSVDCDGVAAQWLSPVGHRPERVLLYIHGGAFVAYTPDVYAAMVASWCQNLKTRALLVDYSLAPEHPYPTALEECLAAYLWLLGQGFEARDIVIAGDSAGGNLVLATLQRLKADQQPLPSCAVLLSPFWTSPSAAKVHAATLLTTRSSRCPSPSACGISTRPPRSTRTPRYRHCSAISPACRPYCSRWAARKCCWTTRCAPRPGLMPPACLCSWRYGSAWRMCSS